MYMYTVYIYAFQAGDSYKAEQLLHLALKIAQELQDFEAITYIYDTMANLALENGQLEKAEILFKNVVQRLFERGMQKDDNAFLEISLKLAIIFGQTGRPLEAESGYDYCLKHLSQKLTAEVKRDEDTVLLFAMCADAYGRHLMTIKKYEEAAHYFSNALDACKQALGHNHPQTSVVINNLASAVSMLGKYDEAVYLMKEAINVAVNQQSDDVTSYYFNLATLYLQMKQFSDAKFCCKKALEKTPPGGQPHRQAVDCLENVRRIMEELETHRP